MQAPADIQDVIAHIRHALDHAFARLDAWFDHPASERQYRPQAGGWTVEEVLEHVGLTNHFLLILIDKGAAKALKNQAGLDLATELQGYRFADARLDEIGLHKSFEWMRPAHMEPTGAQPLAAVRRQLHEQLRHCHRVLDALPHGEGVRYRTTMSVNGLGKIDVYQYVYFLARHAERHLAQLARIREEYRAATR
ncbi:DinB family protein [Hymenobacter sp. 15J16-1T3B]|uniref:DinB family protein n=1 Tax=Hymenobacter sp. 15J16-1T3B TaxID=2886941 RepID=UPI001D10FB11|nr:DinB family protein [Hymenobacter sp. 15J16-1T3B]MCC3159645.1 DinB family protein [Hymenobacter sp. 15J16-1T3B]